MDPFTIIGTTGAIVGMIDIITRSISKLRELHDRWRDADMTIMNITSQLAALRAALSKIAEWVSSDLQDVPQHHQLIIDIGDCIDCCRNLIKTMDDHISKVDSRTTDALNLSSKIRRVFNDKAFRDIQIFMERQTNALTLLLTACNSKTLSEQKTLLEALESRRIFDQLKDDSSSMVVLRDAASCASKSSQSTGTSSKLSKVFPGLDAELMSSLVYQRAVRSLFKRASGKSALAILRSASDGALKRISTTDKRLSASVSTNIDAILEVERDLQRYQARLLLLGSSSDIMYSFLSMIKVFTGEPHNHEKLLEYRDSIVSLVVGSAKELLDTYREDLDKSHCNYVPYLRLGHPASQTIPSQLITVLKALWHADADYEGSAKVSSRCSIYFLDNLERIMQAGFVPTDTDVFIFEIYRRQGIQEFKYMVGLLEYNILHCGAVRNERAKWLHQLENITALLFVVDLDASTQIIYARDSEGDMTARARLQQDYSLFASISQVPWFSTIPMILIFMNTDLSEEALSCDKMSQRWQDYQEQMLSHFKQADPNRAKGKGDTPLLYALFADSRSFDLRGLVSYVQDIVIQKNIAELLSIS